VVLAFEPSGYCWGSCCLVQHFSGEDGTKQAEPQHRWEGVDRHAAQLRNQAHTGITGWRKHTFIFEDVTDKTTLKLFVIVRVAGKELYFEYPRRRAILITTAMVCRTSTS